MRPLKPFEGPSPTGFYNFNGKPLEQHEVDTLRANGVRIPETPFAWNPVIKKSEGYVSKEWDIMPDNRLKDTKYRKRFAERQVTENKRPKTRKMMLSDEEFAEKFHQWREEWAALGDDRPDFIAWFANHKTDEIGKQLLFDAFQSARSGGAAKSLGVLLEFGRMKPKQQIENIGERMTPATPEQLLDVFSQVFNIPREKVNELLAQIPKQ